MSSILAEGMRKDSKKRHSSKILLLILLAVLFISFSATVVEAGRFDNVGNAWRSMRVFVFSAAFWINTLIVFSVLFILYTLLLSQKVGSDTAQKTIMYLVIGIIAIVIATKFVDSSGSPQYIWENNQFRTFTQFLIGPAHNLGSCSGGSHSLIRTALGINPNPPCCGTGAYFTTIQGDRVCKQAILRVNENGSGLGAFIIATILFYLLFSAFRTQLGINNLGSGGEKWFPILLSLLLGALMANARVTKNNIIMIGGWIVFILLGKALSKSLSGEEKGGAKYGLGYGLAYGLVQTIANMLGSSLFGGSFDAGDITISRIMMNILIGAIIGYLFNVLSGEGIWKKIKERYDQKRKIGVGKYMDEGRTAKAYARSFDPFGRWFFSHPAEEEQQRREDENINEQFNRLNAVYERELARVPQNPVRLRRIEQMLEQLIQRMGNNAEARNEIRNVEEEADRWGRPGAAPEPPNIE